MRDRRSMVGYVQKREPWLILLEFMELGNLRDYLREVRPRVAFRVPDRRCSVAAGAGTRRRT